MKERPILFSAEMVRAILDGRKTQTRRVVKGEMLSSLGDLPHVPGWIVAEVPRLCPYGQPGDRLWVRETYFAYGRWETRFSEKKGRDEWHFVDMTLECDRAYQYAADAPDVPLATNRGGVLPGWWRRPSIFMPRVAARFTPEITNVRIERLQDIGWMDAIAEGIRDPRRGLRRVDPVDGCVAQYRALWDSLNAKRGVGWDVNPWAWVIDFRRLAGS